MSETEKELVIRRTITIEYQLKYVDGLYGPEVNSVEEAAEYERNLLLGDKVQAMIESLPFMTDEQIDFGETITIQDVVD